MLNVLISLLLEMERNHRTGHHGLIMPWHVDVQLEKIFKKIKIFSDFLSFLF